MGKDSQKEEEKKGESKGADPETMQGGHSIDDGDGSKLNQAGPSGVPHNRAALTSPTDMTALHVSNSQEKDMNFSEVKEGEHKRQFLVRSGTLDLTFFHSLDISTKDLLVSREDECQLSSMAEWLPSACRSCTLAEWFSSQVPVSVSNDQSCCHMQRSLTRGKYPESIRLSQRSNVLHTSVRGSSRKYFFENTLIASPKKDIGSLSSQDYSLIQDVSQLPKERNPENIQPNYTPPIGGKLLCTTPKKEAISPNSPIQDPSLAERYKLVDECLVRTLRVLLERPTCNRNLTLSQFTKQNIPSSSNHNNSKSLEKLNISPQNSTTDIIPPSASLATTDRSICLASNAMRRPKTGHSQLAHDNKADVESFSTWTQDKSQLRSVVLPTDPSVLSSRNPVGENPSQTMPESNSSRGQTQTDPSLHRRKRVGHKDKNLQRLSPKKGKGSVRASRKKHKVSIAVVPSTCKQVLKITSGILLPDDLINDRYIRRLFVHDRYPKRKTKEEVLNVANSGEGNSLSLMPNVPPSTSRASPGVPTSSAVPPSQSCHEPTTTSASMEVPHSEPGQSRTIQRPEVRLEERQGFLATMRGQLYDFNEEGLTIDSQGFIPSLLDNVVDDGTQTQSQSPW